LHRAQSVIELRLGANRPPVVQEDLDRPPQRHPGPDRNAFLDQSPVVVAADQPADQIADEYGERDEGHADDETPAPHAEQLPEALSRTRGAVSEVLADCLAQ
jgi:hypothetical protein